MKKFFVRKILWWVLILICGIIAFSVVSVRTYCGIDKEQNLFIEECYIDDIFHEEIGTSNGIMKDGEMYRVVGDDPYIIYLVVMLLYYLILGGSRVQAMTSNIIMRGYQNLLLIFLKRWIRKGLRLPVAWMLRWVVL